MAAWEIGERHDRWVVRRDGVLKLAGDAPAVWAYVAERAADDDVVLVRYVTGRSGQPLSGAALRALLAGERRGAE